MSTRCFVMLCLAALVSAIAVAACGSSTKPSSSDVKVIRGHVSRQGSRILRWAMTEAIQRQSAGTRPQQVKDSADNCDLGRDSRRGA